MTLPMRVIIHFHLWTCIECTTGSEKIGFLAIQRTEETMKRYEKASNVANNIEVHEQWVTRRFVWNES